MPGPVVGQELYWLVLCFAIVEDFPLGAGVNLCLALDSVDRNVTEINMVKLSLPLSS